MSIVICRCLTSSMLYASIDGKKIMKYTRYQSNQQALKCVQYWDKVFRGTKLFFDWQATYASVEYHIPLVQKEFKLSKKAARNLVWNAYCDAATGDADSPFFEEFDQLASSVPVEDMAFFILVKSVGVDIQSGYSQRQAEQQFKIWLAEDPNNGVYGDFKIQADLSIERVRHG